MSQVVTVPAYSACSVGWVDTTIDIAQGQHLSITAAGTVHWESGGDDVGPDGDPTWDFGHPYVWDTKLLNKLIGYVGQISNLCTFNPADDDIGLLDIGASFNGLAPRSGRLYLCVNDQPGTFGDNSGSFSVSVDVELGEPSNTGASDCPICHAGEESIPGSNPISLRHAEKREEVVDLALTTPAGILDFRRTFRQVKRAGTMGLGWSHNQLLYLDKVAGTPNEVIVQLPNGGEAHFLESGPSSNHYDGLPGVPSYVDFASSLYTLTATDQSKYIFEQDSGTNTNHFRVLYRQWPTGEKWRYRYNTTAGDTGAASGRLTSVEDLDPLIPTPETARRKLVFRYYSGGVFDGLLYRVGDQTFDDTSPDNPTGRYVQFSYMQGRTVDDTDAIVDSTDAADRLLVRMRDVRGQIWGYRYYGQDTSNDTDKRLLNFLVGKHSPDIDATGDGAPDIALSQEQDTYTATANDLAVNFNGNMETTGGGGWSAVGAATLTFVTTPVHSGTKSLQVSANTGQGAKSSAFVVTPGRTYIINAWVRINSGASVTMSLSADPSTSKTLSTTGSWKLLRLTYTALELDPTVTLQFVANGTSSFYIDDVSVQEIRVDSIAQRRGYTMQELAANGDMEANTTWTAVNGATTAQVTAPTYPVYSGSASWRVVTTGSGQGLQGNTWAMTAGRTYVISAQVYTSSGTVKMQVPGQSTLDRLTLTTGVWETLQAIYTPSSSPTGLTLQFVASSGTPTFYVDAVSILEVDWAGNSTQVPSHMARTTLYEFQPNRSNVTTETTAGKTITHLFNGGTYGGVEDAGGNVTLQDVGAEFRPHSQQDANGNPTTLDWNATGKLLNAVTDALGNETSFAYDSLDRLIASTDAENRKTTYLYDGVLRQPVTVLVSDSTVGEIDVNGGMELDSGWVNVGTPSVNARVTGSPHQVDSGTYSRRVIGTVGQGIESAKFGLTAAHTYVVIARVYIVSGAVKMTATGTAGFDKVLSTTGSWQTLRTLFTPTTTIASNQLRFLADGGSAEFYVDSVHVVDVINLLRWQEFRYDSVGHTVFEATISIQDGSVLQQTTRSYYTSGNGNGLLQTVTIKEMGGANDQSTTYFYDTAGRVFKTQQLNTFGGCDKSFTLYDAAGNVLASICNYVNAGADPTTVAGAIALFDSTKPDENKVTTYEYDALRRRIKITTDAGASYALSSITVYDGLDRVIRTITNYDAAFAPTNPYTTSQSTFGHGADNTKNLITDMLYNQRGMVRKQVDVLGNVTLYGYDDAGRLVKTIQSASQANYDNDYGTTGDAALRYYVTSSAPDMDIITLSAFDPAGNLIKTTDPLGNISFTIYDALNRPVKVVRSASNPDYDILNDPLLLGYSFSADADKDLVEAMDYDALGRVRRTRDTLNNWTLFGYDGLGRQVKVIRNPSNPDYDTELDAALANYIASNAVDTDIVTETAYDVQGRVMYTIDPLDRRTWTAYDGLGRAVRTVVNATGTATDGGVQDPRSPNYLPVGNLADKDLISLTTYDADSRVLYTTDPLGNRTWPVYDSVDRVIRTVTNATGTAIDLGPSDPRGEFYIPSADADKDIITRTVYDAQGRVLETIDALGRRARFIYDLLGRRVSTIANYETGTYNPARPDQDLVSITEYDIAGRVISTTDPRGTKTTFTYDQVGRRLTVTQAANTPLATTSYNCYDKAGRVLRTIQNWVVIEANQPAPDDKDGNGNVLFVPTAHGPNEDINLVSTFVLDKLGRQLSMSDPLGNQTSMIYYKDGQLQALTDPEGSVSQYRYDLLRRRVTVVQGYLAQATDPAAWVWDSGDGRWEDGI